MYGKITTGKNVKQCYFWDMLTNMKCCYFWKGHLFGGWGVGGGGTFRTLGYSYRALYDFATCSCRSQAVEIFMTINDNNNDIKRQQL